LLNHDFETNPMGASIRFSASTSKAIEKDPFEGGEIDLEGGAPFRPKDEFKALGFSLPSFSTPFDLLTTPNREDADMLLQIEQKLTYQLDALTILRTSIDSQIFLSEDGIFGLTDL